MTKLTCTELQEINAGIALSLPRKQGNQSLACTKDPEDGASAAGKEARESRHLLHILNLAVQQGERA